jgi:hypothetical protein
MSRKPTPPLFRLALAALATATAAGCTLERSIIPAWGEVTPTQVCPGDTVTVSWDFLRTETCRSDELCAMHHPTVAVTSSPAAFPPRTVTGYRDSFTFNPTADLTRVDFGIDRSAVRVPTTRVDDAGRPVDAIREGLRNDWREVRRITGSQETELVHDGMCAGNTPVNSPENLPGPPASSANLRLVSLCNRNGVAVVVTLNGSNPGDTVTQALRPGDCLNTDAPGMPATIDAARVVEVRPMFTDPGVRCSATGPNSPPPTLRTVAVMACR